MAANKIPNNLLSVCSSCRCAFEKAFALPCRRCRAANYCSKLCQQRHAQDHNKECSAPEPGCSDGGQACYSAQAAKEAFYILHKELHKLDVASLSAKTPKRAVFVNMQQTALRREFAWCLWTQAQVEEDISPSPIKDYCLQLFQEHTNNPKTSIVGVLGSKRSLTICVAITDM